MSGPEVLVKSPEGGVADYKVALKRRAHAAVDPVVRGLIAVGIGADHLTALGFVLSLAAALEFATGRFRYASALAAFAGLCDILDGQVARLSATGLGNADVAARLNLSVRSVEGHLHAIRTKLGLGSRAQVAAWAVGQVDVSV